MSFQSRQPCRNILPQPRKNLGEIALFKLVRIHLHSCRNFLLKRQIAVVRSSLITLALSLIGSPFLGCATTAYPRLFGPGTAQQQRFQATLHDPYQDPEAAPEDPAVRPPGFRKPLAEPVRERWLRDTIWWLPRG
jgi:hypothetical protein